MNFLVSEPEYKIEEADAVILPIAYEDTASFRKGTRNAPREIIKASYAVEEYDAELGREVCYEIKMATHPVVELDGLKPEMATGKISLLSSKLRNKFVATIGGEHSITYGLLKERKPDFSILYIDAHPDLRNELYGNLVSHGTVARRLMEKGYDITFVGARAMSIEEAHFIKKNNVSVFYGNDFEIDEVVSKLGENVYVSIDADGFDPSVFPSVGTPEPGGISWEKGVGLLRAVAKTREVVGFDFVEAVPEENKTTQFVGAELIYKLIGYKFFL
ncbi:MAG: agmatinase [Candidatus Anstonellales archaeon]